MAVDTQPTLAQLIRGRILGQPMAPPTADVDPQDPMHVPAPSQPLGGGAPAPDLTQYGALPGGIANRPQSNLDQPPPRPRLAQRIIGGFEGQPNGGVAGTLAGMARGALAGALGPTQRQDIEAERQIGQRGGQEMALERQREAYGLPEQQARIGAQEASTQQSQLQSEILKNRIDAMKRMQQPGGEADPFLQLGVLGPDEQAIRDAAYDEFSYTANPASLMQGVSKIYQQRAVSGRLGPGVNTYDPNAPGGVTRQQFTRGGQPAMNIPGVVVPGTLPRTSSTEQLVPTAGGGMAAVTKPVTTTPVLPGQGGGGGAQPRVSNVPVQPRLPAQEQRTEDTATVALKAIPDIAGQLGQLRDKLELGPLQGRIQELRRSIGNADPTYVQLKTNIHLLVSALSVMHFGARGNQQWLQDFSANADAGAMNYDDLRAGLGVMEKWIRRYQTVGERGVVDDQVSAPGASRGR